MNEIQDLPSLDLSVTQPQNSNNTEHLFCALYLWIKVSMANSHRQNKD